MSKRSIFTTFRMWLRRTWSILVFAVAIANFIMACSVSRSTRPQYIYTVTTNEIVRVSCVTQYLQSAASPVDDPVLSAFSSSSASSSDVPKQRTEISTYHYRYMLVNGNRAVELFGRIHYLGSRTSYGRIVEIFPDRIILDTGFVINNKNLEKEPSYGSAAVGSTLGGARRDQ